MVRNRGFFLSDERSFQQIHLYLSRTTVLRTSVLRQAISRTDVKKNKHSFILVQVVRLSSSNDPFGFPSKVVTSNLFVCFCRYKISLSKNVYYQPIAKISCLFTYMVLVVNIFYVLNSRRRCKKHI